MGEFKAPDTTPSPSPPGSHRGEIRAPSGTPSSKSSDSHLGPVRVPDGTPSPSPSPEASPEVSPPPPNKPKYTVIGGRRVLNGHHRGDKPPYVAQRVGKPYKPRRQVLVVSDKAPKSPQDGRKEPRTWMRTDQFTGKRALIKEILRKPINWVGYSDILYVTSHSNLVSMLDASGLPPKDENGNYLRDENRKLVFKTAEQKYNSEVPWESWEHMESTVGKILKDFPNGVEENLIWHVMFSLLRAVLWLHHGRRNEFAPQTRVNLTPLRHPVVHNNINPDSIFVDKPWDTKQGVMYYGSIKLGNFSRNMTLPVGGIKDYVDERYWTGPNYEQHADFDAPEFSWLGAHQTPDRPYGGRSDIWSIGAVLVQLMGGLDLSKRTRNIHRWQEKDRSNVFVLRAVEFFDQKKEGFTADDLPLDYDITLRTVIAGFLKFNPLKRPDASDALLRANAHFKKWCENDENFKWERWYEAQKAKLIKAEKERAEKADKAFRARKQLEKMAEDEKKMVGGHAPRPGLYAPGRANNPFAATVPHVVDRYTKTSAELAAESRLVKERKDAMEKKLQNAAAGHSTKARAATVETVDDDEESAS